MCTGVCRLSTLQTESRNRYQEGCTLSGVIYVHRISDNRFGGVTVRNFSLFRKLCGESTLDNVVIVTNMWKEDSRDVDEARERELSDRFFKPALDKGARMARHYNTTQSAHDIVRRIVKNHPVVLQIQRELVDEGKDITATAAGESLNEELKEQIRKHQIELKGLKEDMAQALVEKDNETRRELEAVRRNLEEKIKKVKEDSENMVANFVAEKARMEAKMKEMKRGVEHERQRAGAENNRNLAAARPQRTPNAPAIGRAGREQEGKKGRITIPVFK